MDVLIELVLAILVGPTTNGGSTDKSAIGS